LQLIDGGHRLELEVPRITLNSVTLCSIVVGLREFYRWRMLIDQPCGSAGIMDTLGGRTTSCISGATLCSSMSLSGRLV